VPFPVGIKAPVQYGKNFRVLLAYLYDAQEGASRRIREMCAEMFGSAVSEATLQAARQEQHAALEPYENRLVEICSVPRFFRELFPFGCRGNREAMTGY